MASSHSNSEMYEKRGAATEHAEKRERAAPMFPGELDPDIRSENS